MQMTISHKRSLVIAGIGAFLALIPALYLFDFTVDDALIIARYAHHLAHGVGYRWNIHGPITDTITPLGFPYLLAPFAQTSVLAALSASKLIGLFAWLMGAGFVAVAVDRSSTDRKRFTALLMLPVSAPLAAWSVAGLETGFVTALSATGVALIALAWPRVGAGLLGIASAFRPELAPFTFVATLAPCPDKPRPTARDLVQRLVLTMGPFVLVAVTRVMIFGRPTPLATLAKPSDPTLGLMYSAACFLITGPLVIVAPFAVRRAELFVQILMGAILVHFAAIAVAGGDWMPLSRLAVPVLPACMIVAAHLASVARIPSTALRTLLALAGEIFVLVTKGPVAAKVGQDRRDLIQIMEPALKDAKVIGTLDAGWVGAATDAMIVDFAGLTDPSIAALPGSHTAKHIDRSMLDKRGVDTLVLMRSPTDPTETPWTDTRFSHVVEMRIARFPGYGDEFVLAAESPLPILPYLVLRRRPDPANELNREGP